VANKPCTLTGTNLFLAASISAAEDFSNATEIPPDFTGGQLGVPHPANGGVLYLKLRDDPQTVQTLTLPVTLVTPANAPAQTSAVSQAPPASVSVTPPADSTPPSKPENQ
jgi:hypothetical protein